LLGSFSGVSHSLISLIFSSGLSSISDNLRFLVDGCFDIKVHSNYKSDHNQFLSKKKVETRLVLEIVAEVQAVILWQSVFGHVLVNEEIWNTN
jgi:hypothetical protein